MTERHDRTTRMETNYTEYNSDTGRTSVIFDPDNDAAWIRSTLAVEIER